MRNRMSIRTGRVAKARKLARFVRDDPRVAALVGLIDQVDKALKALPTPILDDSGVMPPQLRRFIEAEEAVVREWGRLRSLRNEPVQVPERITFAEVNPPTFNDVTTVSELDEPW